jgi:hypothetical protein
LSRAGLIGLSCLLASAACQELDSTASVGVTEPDAAARASVDRMVPPPPDAPPGPSAEPEDEGDDRCASIRSQARAVRELNCAPCHQSPAKEGNFYFILDDDVLASAVSSTGQRFIVPGAPDDSRLFRRVAAGEMPPRARMQRPSGADVAVLRQWITGCVRPGSQGGEGETHKNDGSAPPDDPGDDPGPSAGCGQPGQSCCGANECHDGACCVFGQCRANGQACGGIVGGLPDGLPGMCTAGSCRTGAAACGGVAQACCGESGTCTAPRAGCAMGLMCQACGGPGQSCCQNGGAATCLAGFSCSFTGFGRPSACEPCGARDQPCCGNGLAAQKTCNTGLTCRFVAGMGDHCAQ